MESRISKARRIRDYYKNILLNKPYGKTYNFAKYWGGRLLKIEYLIIDLKYEVIKD
jgi:hypothetical protein